MADKPTVLIYPHGVEGDFPDGPPTAVVRHQGFRLELRFAPGDFAGEGDPEELRLLRDTAPLDGGTLRRFAPKSDLYLALARSAMWLSTPFDELPDRQLRFHRAAEALREIAGPGRGLTDEFYRQIGAEHEALVAGGERHPVKALSQMHHVTISASSRWVKEARRRGYITPTNEGTTLTSTTT